MKIFFFTLPFLFLGWSIQAQTFSSGNEFTAVPIFGEVSVQCRDFVNNRTNFAVYQCEDLRLNPVEYDFFVGANVDADKVSLSCTQPKGKVVNKSSSYKNGKSTDRFNLWIISLLQKPLLDIGENQITYKLTKKGKLVTEGQLTVPVTVGKRQTCPRGFISSNDPNDCTTSFNVCRQYFSQYNYCM